MNLKRRQRNLVGIVAAGLVVAAATLMVVQSKGGISAPAWGGSFSFADETAFDIPRPISSPSPNYSARSSAPVPKAPGINTSSAPLDKPQIRELQRSTEDALLTREDLLAITGSGLSDNELAWGSDSATRNASNAVGGYGGGGGRSFPSGGGGGVSSGGFPGGGGGGVGSSASSNAASGGLAQTASLAGGRPSASPSAPQASLNVTASGAFGQTSNAPAALTASPSASGSQSVSTLQTPVSVPEPTSLLLLGGSVATVLYRRRRRSGN